MSNSHMQLFTSFGWWYVVDGNCGGCIIPVDALTVSQREDVDSVLIGAGMLESEDEGDAFHTAAETLLNYYEGSRLISMERVQGWCARYSAPGYMDATDWCGPYATEDEAAEECRSLYGDEDEDEDAQEETSNA